jgi:hypothetical protein
MKAPLINFLSPGILRNFMPFISCAQNYEHVIRGVAPHLSGASRRCRSGEPRGAFCYQGLLRASWSGINVEPLDEYLRSSCQPDRDANLKVVLGRRLGDAPARHRRYGPPRWTRRSRSAPSRWPANHETVVPVLTLEKILEDCAPVTIHFLKIDIEGVGF